MHKTFSDKTRTMMLVASNGYCQCSKNCTKLADQAHHKLSNTKVNQRLYPLFLQSPFNCAMLNHDCHISKPLPRIRECEVIVYEEYLQDLLQMQKL